MGLAAKKLDIINWITNLNDEEILEKINSLRKREDELRAFYVKEIKL